MNATDLLKNLQVPELTSAAYAADFNILIKNIDDNFKILAGAPFGVGGQGSSIVHYKEYIFEEVDEIVNVTDVGMNVLNTLFPAAEIDMTEDGTRDWEEIKSKINNEDLYKPINNIEITSFWDNESITNYCWEWAGTELIDGSHNRIIPIALYQFYDPRTRGVGTESRDFLDASAAVYANFDRETDELKYSLLSIYPKLYFDSSRDTWSWNINGENTGISSVGPTGEPGASGTVFLYDEDLGQYLYLGESKAESEMKSILTDGSVRFRVKTLGDGEEIKSRVYLDSYKKGDGEEDGAWMPGPELYKTIDNMLMKKYFDELYPRNIQTNDPATYRFLGLPIFNSYNPFDDSIGTPAADPIVGHPTIGGYHSIETRFISGVPGSIKTKLLFQPVSGSESISNVAVAKKLNTLSGQSIEFLDYDKLDVCKSGAPGILSLSHNLLSMGSTKLKGNSLEVGSTKLEHGQLQVMGGNKLTYETLYLYNDLAESEDDKFPSWLNYTQLAIGKSTKLTNKSLIIEGGAKLEKELLTVRSTKLKENLLEMSTSRGKQLSPLLTELTNKSLIIEGGAKLEKELLTIGSTKLKGDSLIIENGLDINTSKADSIIIQDTSKTKTGSVISKESLIFTDKGINDDGTLIPNNNTKYSTLNKDSIEFINHNVTNTSKLTNTQLELVKTGISNIQTPDDIILTNGTKTNTSKADSIEIKDGTDIAEINPYGGMLVPIGGIIMWTLSIDEIPKGFIPCGHFDNHSSFHENNVIPYWEKLFGIGERPQMSFAGGPIVSGRYVSFNNMSIPNFPNPSYPVSDVNSNGDCKYNTSYSTFIYIMRVF